MLTEVEFRHGLLDPQVKKQRVMIYGRGVYVDVAALKKALDDRGYGADEGELDRYVDTLGGHRVERGKWFKRMNRSGRLARRSQYFLPELAFQRIRQRH